MIRVWGIWPVVLVIARAEGVQKGAGHEGWEGLFFIMVFLLHRVGGEAEQEWWRWQCGRGSGDEMQGVGFRV
jgi:hypothetical protein